MYIEPCCIDRHLPELLRKEPFCFFQSNGDWTVRDLMKAVSFLAAEGVALLAIPDVNVFLLRTLRTYLVKNWYHSLVLVTREDRTDLVTNEMGSSLSKIRYAFDRRLNGEIFALAGSERFLAIQGPMPLDKDFKLCHYAAYYGVSAEHFLSCTEAVVSIARVSPSITGEDKLIEQFLNKRHESRR